jgi:tetratricopeptide (TPR) repeat protein
MVLSSKFFTRERIILIAIFLFAFLLRLIHILQYMDNPFFTTLLGDPSYYDNWAQKIAQGMFRGAEPDGGELTFFRGPVYSLILAAFYKIFGHDVLIPRIFQAILGAMSCLLVALIARRLFDQKIGILAGFIAALCGSLIYFDGEILVTSLVVFLNLLVVLLIIEWVNGFEISNFDIKRSSIKILGIGLIMGISAVARPNILLFFAVLLLYLLFKFMKSGMRRRSVVIVLSIFVLGTSLPILPVTLWNLFVGKDFVIISYQAGVNFYIGNNPHSDGRSAIIPGLGTDWDEVSIAERDIGKRLKPSEVDRYWLKKGFQFILENPKSSSILFIKKFLFFWNGYEIGNNQETYLFANQFPFLNSLIFRIPLPANVSLHIPFGLLSPLGIIGIFLAWREGQRIKRIKRIKRIDGINILLLYLISYMFGVILFFVSDRYRLPVVPIVIIFSVYALTRIIGWFKKRETKPSTIFLLIFILLFIGLNINLTKPRNFNLANEHFKMGVVHKVNDQPEEAIKEFEKALEIHPRFPRAHLNLGALHFFQGEQEQAVQEYHKEIEINPKEARTYNNLSVIYRIEGDYEKAKRFCLMAINLRPRFREPYLNLARIYEEMDSLLAVERTYLALLEFYPSSPEAYQGLGRIYDWLNLFDMSILAYEKALRFEPEDAEIHYNLGVVYGKANLIQEALKSLMRAVEIDPKLAQAHHNIGMVYFQTRDYEEAIRSFHKAIEMDSLLIEPHISLALLYQQIGRKEESERELRKVEALSRKKEKRLENIE